MARVAEYRYWVVPLGRIALAARSNDLVRAQRLAQRLADNTDCRYQVHDTASGTHVYLGIPGQALPSYRPSRQRRAARVASCPP
jgi:hypothetical protein